MVENSVSFDGHIVGGQTRDRIVGAEEGAEDRQEAYIHDIICKSAPAVPIGDSPS